MRDQAAGLRALVGKGVEPKILTVASGKGGVGKTNLSANLGLTLASRGLRVCLFDADLGLPNLDLVLGVSPPHTVAEALAGEIGLSQALMVGPRGLGVLAGGRDIKLAELSAEKVEFLAQELMELVLDYDLFIVDCGAGLGPAVRSFAATADWLLLVTTPDPAAITDGYGLLKFLSQERITAEVSMVVNMVHSLAESKDVIQRLTLAAERFLELEIQAWGQIPYDEELVRKARQQKPVALAAPRSISARSIGKIAEQIEEKMGKPSPRPQGSLRGLWNKFLGQNFGLGR